MPSLEKISLALDLSDDVAGATFMAAGSSAPELFASLTSLINPDADDSIGIATIVGSAIFNVLVIIGVTGAAAGQVRVVACARASPAREGGRESLGGLGKQWSMTCEADCDRGRVRTPNCKTRRPLVLMRKCPKTFSTFWRDQVGALLFGRTAETESVRRECWDNASSQWDKANPSKT